MMIFNQDSADASRVNLFHLSTVDSQIYEEALDLGLDFIWKTMHCQSIRVYLHHFRSQNGEDKLKVNEEIKGLLKQRRFKWKTLKNETATG